MGQKNPVVSRNRIFFFSFWWAGGYFARLTLAPVSWTRSGIRIFRNSLRGGNSRFRTPSEAPGAWKTLLQGVINNLRDRGARMDRGRGNDISAGKKCYFEESFLFLIQERSE